MPTGDIALWLAGTVMEAVFVAVLLRRRAFRLLPLFSVYIVWALVSDVGGVAVHRFYPDRYFDVYVVEMGVDAVLQFGVLVELAWSILRPYWSALPSGALVVVALSIFAAGALVWPFATVPGFTDLPPEWRGLMRLQQTFSILRVLFFVDLVGCSKALEVGWRHRELQVAVGLGFYSMVSLVVSILHSYRMESPYYHVLDQIVAGSYFCSLLYWVLSFIQQDAPRREFNPRVHGALLSLVGTKRLPQADSTRVESRDRGAA